MTEDHKHNPVAAKPYDAQHTYARCAGCSAALVRYTTRFDEGWIEGHQNADQVANLFADYRWDP